MSEELLDDFLLLDELCEIDLELYIDKRNEKLAELRRRLKAFDKQKEKPIQCPGCKIWINLGEKYFKHLLEEE